MLFILRQLHFGQSTFCPKIWSHVNNCRPEMYSKYCSFFNLSLPKLSFLQIRITDKIQITDPNYGFRCWLLMLLEIGRCQYEWAGVRGHQGNRQHHSQVGYPNGISLNVLFFFGGGGFMIFQKRIYLAKCTYFVIKNKNSVLKNSHEEFDSLLWGEGFHFAS